MLDALIEAQKAQGNMDELQKVKWLDDEEEVEEEKSVDLAENEAEEAQI